MSVCDDPAARIYVISLGRARRASFHILHDHITFLSRELRAHTTLDSQGHPCRHTAAAQAARVTSASYPRASSETFVERCDGLG